MSEKSTNPIRVTDTTKAREAGAEKPAHWVDSKGSAFVNPWPSWRSHDIKDFLMAPFQVIGQSPKIPKNVADLLPVRKPTWGLDSTGVATQEDSKGDKIKATWLGHACFLVEFPRTVSLSRGPRVLFDPVFSDRCSPSQHIGPKRFTPPPCDLKDLPELDAIVISHNHYDHLDTHTIQTLTSRPRTPHIFAPLGNQAYFDSLGIPRTHVHIMDWWDSRRVEIEIPSMDSAGGKIENQKTTIDITCTPGQHFTGRGIMDRFKSLWAGWVVETDPMPMLGSDVPSTESPTLDKGVKVYFAGDTGYRAVLPGDDEDKLPVCPAFKDIGKKFGGFDLALLPIGAYLPRRFMSPIHCSPADSVLVYKDVLARRAIGMHWGTWILTTEDILAPPKVLAEECKKVGIEEGLFTVCDIGETVSV